MPYFRCEGASKTEAHGATIIVSSGADGIDCPCSLYMGSTLIDTKILDSSGNATFTDLIEIGAYTAKVTKGEKVFENSAIVSASDILNKSVIPLSVKIITAVYLYNTGDECISVSGGWSNFSDTTYGDYQKRNDCLYASAKTFDVRVGYDSTPIINLSDYSYLCVEAKSVGTAWNCTIVNSNSADSSKNVPASSNYTIIKVPLVVGAYRIWIFTDKAYIQEIYIKKVWLE